MEGNDEVLSGTEISTKCVPPHSNKYWRSAIIETAITFLYRQTQTMAA